LADDETESVAWKIKMAALDGALNISNSQYNRGTLSMFYESSKRKTHSEAYIAGLIGEREGRKWLKEQGYEQ
jgi:hypothetical protein